jgi:hypothetical protein
MWLAMVGKRITTLEAVSTIPTRRFCRRVFHPHNSVDLGAIEACPASLAALQSYRRQEALHRCRVGGSEGRSGVTLGEGAMTVAELIEKLSALPDKTALVVKSPGPWDGLNEPGLIHDGYVDKEMQFPVQATEQDAIHVVFL